MSSRATVDFEVLLAPIAGNNPSGESLRASPIYDTIKQASNEEDPKLSQGDWKHELKVANWREVTRIATEALGAKSKDLQISAWLSQALIKQHGFVGGRDGLRLLGALLERFWDTVYPLPEDGDLEFRGSALEWINQRLPAALSELALTDGAGEKYSLVEWRESRQVEDAGRKSPEERQALLAEGKISGELWDKAVAEGSRAFYEQLFEAVGESLEECKKLETTVDQKFGRDAPSLLDVKHVLEECCSLVEPILVKKRELEPDPPRSEATASNTPTPRPSNGIAVNDQSVKVVSVASNARAPDATDFIAVEPTSRADALQRLEAIAEFFHRSEPHSPIAYLVERAVRWGQMPLEDWLKEVISDQGVLAHIRETLGIKNPEQAGG